MLEGITKRIRNKYLYYPLTFFGNLAIYSLPLAYLHYKHIEVVSLNNVYAKLVYSILSIFLDKLALYNNEISYDNIVFVVNTECVGYKSFLGMFALIMATPILSIKERFKWALIFSTIMLIVNFIRVLSVITLGYYGYNVFFIHNILWQILNNVVVITLWIVFLIKIGNIKLNKKILFSRS